MSILGIPEARLVQATSALSPRPGAADVEPLDLSLALEAFARATWSGLAEPGDRAAGVVVEALGAFGALEALIDRRSWESLAAESPELDARLSAEEWAQASSRFEPRLSARRALESLDHAARLGASLLTPEHPLWPAGLDDLAEHRPLALWLRGDPAHLATLPRSIALVGARAATGYGEHVAAEAAAGLVERGFAVVSGAAYGIDGMAHRSALAAGGSTLAFLAGGPDRLYPAGHEELLQRIMRHGLVLAELPCGQSPTRWRFLQRNRLIAAASAATVVVEAGRRSGSLNTAGHAAALARPLGAVPGPVTSPSSAGCHRLIREYGAVCVTDAGEMSELADGWDPSSLVDFAEAAGGASVQPAGAAESAGPIPRLGPTEAERPPTRYAGALPMDARPGRPRPSTEAAGGDPRRTRLLDALSGRAARSSLELARSSGLAVAEVQELLGVLGAEGGVESRGTGWVRVGGS